MVYTSIFSATPNHLFPQQLQDSQLELLVDSKMMLFQNPLLDKSIKFYFILNFIIAQSILK